MTRTTVVAIVAVAVILASPFVVLCYRLNNALPMLAARDERVVAGLSGKSPELQRRFITGMLAHFDRKDPTRRTLHAYRIQAWLVSGDGVALAASDSAPLPRPWATLPRPEANGPAVETLQRTVASRLLIARVGESPTRFLVLRSQLVPARLVLLSWYWVLGQLPGMAITAFGGVAAFWIYRRRKPGAV